MDRQVLGDAGAALAVTVPIGIALIAPAFTTILIVAAFVVATAFAIYFNLVPYLRIARRERALYRDRRNV